MFVYPRTLATSDAANQCSPSGNVTLRTRDPVAADTKSSMSIASCSYIEHHLHAGN